MATIPDLPVFADLARIDDWPDSPDATEMFQSRHDWATMHVMRTGVFDLDAAESWSRIALEGPLPIGRNAIHNDERIPAEHRVRAAALAVLQGDEHLALASSARFGRTSCTALFLAEPVGRNQLAWRPAGVAFQIAGYQDDEAVVDTVKSAKKWWGRLAGETFRGRRRDDSDIEAAIRVLADGDVKPSARAVAEYLYPHALKPYDSLYKRLKRYGPVKDVFEGIARRALS